MTISKSIETYRKRRKQLLPVILGAGAVLLVVVGIIIVVTSASGGGLTLFATKTPTPTITPSPTNTLAPTPTMTETETPTITPTATASAPYSYVVVEGDTLYGIMEKNGLGPEAILLFYMINPYNPATGDGIDPTTGTIFVGRTILIPNPGMELPTPTPVANTAPGTRITYMVLPGDGIGLIARKWNTTIERIIQANPVVLKNGQETPLYPGMLLVVPINLVTPVPTAAPTATATP